MQPGDAATRQRPIEATLGELGMQEPGQPGDHEDATRNPLPCFTLNRPNLRRRPKTAGTPEKLNLS